MKSTEVNTITAEQLSSIFCEHGPRALQIKESGTLLNQRLAVKDLFALKGETNSAGNPHWFANSAPSQRTSFSVERLLQQGCEFVGFTHTDELAYSLEGNNIHYGAAENPKLAGHACGGSSMGSAAAVAADLADIGLGTDTGGSIRVPASYCGLFGMRPSHGVIKSDGLIPLAPAFDTTGWFTKDAALLEQVGQTLLPEQNITPVTELVICDELFDLIQPELAEQLQLLITQVKPLFNKVSQFKLEQPAILTQLADTFRVLQGREIARTHKDWITDTKPNLAPAVQQRFDMALALTAEQEQAAKLIQQQWQQILKQNLSDTSVLLLPTTPTIAPKLGADTSSIRMDILTLTAIAGLTGSAQVHLPLLNIESQKANIKDPKLAAPYGFSLLMLTGNDLSLLKLTKELTHELAPHLSSSNAAVKGIK